MGEAGWLGRECGWGLCLTYVLWVSNPDNEQTRVQLKYIVDPHFILEHNKAQAPQAHAEWNVCF